jgi:hypothetical protein
MDLLGDIGAADQLTSSTYPAITRRETFALQVTAIDETSFFLSW